MRTQSTSDASIADSEMNSTDRLSISIVDEWQDSITETYSTVQCGSIAVRARIGYVLFLALAGFIWIIA